MSNGLEEELYDATSGRRPGGEPRTPGATLAWLTAAAGGPGRAARAIGVHPATFRRWRAGSTRPSPRSGDLIQATIRRLRLDPRREARIRSAGVGGFWMLVEERDATYGSRLRTLRAANLRLRADAPERVCDAFLARESLAEAFLACVGDLWYRSWLTDEDNGAYGFNVLRVRWY